MARADNTGVDKQRRSARGETRAEAQRKRILEAAQKCFVAHGFHAASMALISKTAHMSAGLIYRYFDSKDEIILAIIERQLQEAKNRIGAFRSSSDLAAGVSDFLSHQRSDVLDVFNPVLFLEISAEASRNRQIGAALGNTDTALGNAMQEWLRRAAANHGCSLSPDEIQAHQLALQCFIEGIIVRSVRDPDLDPRILGESLQTFFQQLTKHPGENDPQPDSNTPAK